MARAKADDFYGEQEAQHRFEAALRGARLVGHKPQSEMRLGKATGKSKKGLGKRRAKKPQR
jgi:hypothetical protein